MKRSALAMALVSALAIGTAMAEKSMEQARISGELISIEGSTYLIKDTNGIEHTLQVDDKTAKAEGISVGSQVAASVDGDRVTELNLAQ